MFVLIFAESVLQEFARDILSKNNFVVHVCDRPDQLVYVLRLQTYSLIFVQTGFAHECTEDLIASLTNARIVPLFLSNHTTHGLEVDPDEQLVVGDCLAYYARRYGTC